MTTVHPNCKWVILIAGLLSLAVLTPFPSGSRQTPTDFHMSRGIDLGQPFSASSQTGHVAYTLALATNTLVPGNFLQAVGFNPVAVAVDSQNGYLYVADLGSSSVPTSDVSRNVTVIDGTTDKVIGVIGVGDSPDAIGFDSSNGYVYVANGGSNDVTVVDGATSKAIASILVGSHPDGVAFDSTNGYVYITNSGSNNVTVIDGATDNAIAWISLGSSPDAIAFDSSNSYLYVTSFSSSYVAVIDGATNKVIGSILLGQGSEAVAFDNSNGYLYVTNYYSNVAVIDGSTNSVVTSIVMGSAGGVAFDSRNREVYVANTDSMAVINGTSNRVVARISAPGGSGPEGVVFDGLNGNVYVAINGSYNLAVIDGASNVVVTWIPVASFPGALAFDSSNGYLYVTSGYSNEVAVIDGTTNKVVAWIPIGSSPGDLALDSSNGDIYVATGPNNVTVIDGATNKVIASIRTGYGPAGVAYDSSNGYVYVAGNPNVTVIDGASNRVVTSIFVGTFPVGGGGSIVFDSLNGHLYMTSRDTDSVVVIDGTTNQVTGLISAGNAMGAPRIVFDRSKGYMYVTSSYSGNLTVIDGASNQVINSIPLTGIAGGVYVDSLNGEIYVAQPRQGTAGFLSGKLSDNVTVINEAANRVIGSIPVGSNPALIAFDDLNGFLYVTNPYSGSVSIFSGSFNVSASADRVTADVGQPLLFTCTPENGTPPDSFSWSFGDGSPGTGQTLSHVYSTTGSMTATCAATDSSGSLSSGATTIMVSPRLGVNLVATPSSLLVGNRVNLSATAVGGYGEYAYNWSGLPVECGAPTNSPNYSCIFSSAGAYNVTITVTDGNSVSAASYVLITVNPSFLGLPMTLGYEVLAAIVAVPAIGGLISLVWLRRWRKKPAATQK